MKFSTLVLPSLIGALTCAMQAATLAQGPPGGPPPGPGGPGGFGPPGMFGGPGGSSPLVSNALRLIMRPDVQAELRLDLRQKNALQELAQDAGEQMREQMRQNFESLQYLSPEERRQKMEGMREQMEAQMRTFQGEMDAKIRRVLNSAQAQRLHQLDLQRRGPLSLADPRIANEIQIAAEHSAAVKKIYQDYEAKTRQILDQMRPQGGFGRPGQGGPPPEPGQGGPGGQDMRARFTEIQKKMETVRKEAEQKALAALSPAELARWKAALGEPFAFRKELDYGPGFGPPGGPGGPPPGFDGPPGGPPGPPPNGG